MSKSKLERMAMAMRDSSRYIRAARIYHRAKRRPKWERDAASDQLHLYRDLAWKAWREIFEERANLIGPTPWSFASIKCHVKIAG